MDVEPKIGVGFFSPKWMVKIMENPIKMDDLGVPLFLETSIYIYNIYIIDPCKMGSFLLNFPMICSSIFA